MKNANGPPELSIVVPCLNEESAIRPFLDTLDGLCGRLPHIEVIFVDDGSVDGTAESVKLHAKNRAYDVRLVRLSRNFGHQLALLAGMREAVGDAIVTIDVDLQDPPATICDLVEQWRDGYAVVIGQRCDRSSDSWFKRLTAEAFYRALHALTNTPFPMHAADFRLLDRRVVDIMMNTREIEPYWRGLAVWVGFPRTVVQYRRGVRAIGETHYPMRKMIAFAMSAVVAFSRKPLQLASYLGALVSLASISLVVFYVAMSITGRKEFVPGWLSTVSLIGLIGGCQLVCVGILGEYVGRIYELTLQRPNVIIQDSVHVNAGQWASQGGRRTGV